MASFGDRTDYTNYHSNREYHSNVKDYQSKSKEYEHDKPAEYTIPIKKPHPDNQLAPENKGPEKLTEVKETEVTQSVAGPPVFYPPGSTTFVKKEEVMQQVYNNRFYDQTCSVIAQSIILFYSCPTARSIWSGTNEGQGQRNVQVQKQKQVKGKTKFWSDNGASMFANVLCDAMCYHVT